MPTFWVPFPGTGDQQDRVARSGAGVLRNRHVYGDLLLLTGLHLDRRRAHGQHRARAVGACVLTGQDEGEGAVGTLPQAIGLERDGFEDPGAQRDGRGGRAAGRHAQADDRRLSPSACRRECSAKRPEWPGPTCRPERPPWRRRPGRRRAGFPAEELAPVDQLGSHPGPFHRDEEMEGGGAAALHLVERSARSRRPRRTGSASRRCPAGPAGRRTAPASW